MPREGFRVDWKKRMSKKAVCSYFGERGMPLAASEIVGHWVGTYTSRKFDYDAGRSTDEMESVPALAVVIKSKPNGYWEHSDTDAGKVDVYGLRDIYGECLDCDAPRPRKRAVRQ